MQMRRIPGRIAGRSDIPDHVSAAQQLSFNQAVGVAIEMRVVVDHLFGRIRFVDRDSAGLAGEELANFAVDRRQHRRAAGRHDVERPVHVTGACIGEVVFQFFDVHAGDGNDDRVGSDDVRRNRGFGLRNVGRCPRKREHGSKAEPGKNPLSH